MSFGKILPIRVCVLFWNLLIAVFLAIYANEAGPSDTSFSENQGLKDAHYADKRYLAALAKNGRLPKFAISPKKKMENTGSDQNMDPNFTKELVVEVPDEIWMEDKRHVGAFLKTHGKPQFSKALGDNIVRYDRSASFVDDAAASTVDENEEGLDSSMMSKDVKRNIATLAKLGRLNSVRYGRYQPPQYANGAKRVNTYYEEMSDEASNDEENEVPSALNECDESEEEEEENTDDGNEQDNYTNANWTLKKRYVAALARSGRLPVWHTQRMWNSGKRDIPIPYWLRNRSGARPYDSNKQSNSGSMRLVKLKNKRCKKSGANGANALDEIEEKKRNLAMLARKGLLPNRPFISA